jgi:hypothetical protein
MRRQSWHTSKISYAVLSGRPKQNGNFALIEHAAGLATDWEVFLASDIDSERPLPPDEGTEPIPAGVVIAVVLYHGNKHSEG